MLLWRLSRSLARSVPVWDCNKMFLSENEKNNEKNCPTAGSVSLLKCEIYQRGRVSKVADTELIQFTAHHIRHQVQFLV